MWGRESGPPWKITILDPPCLLTVDTYIGSGHFFGSKILNFNILGGFQKNYILWGMNIQSGLMRPPPPPPPHTHTLETGKAILLICKEKSGEGRDSNKREKNTLV